MHTSSPTCRFDRVAYGALIDACIKCGSPDTAESVLAEMEERGREDPKLRPGPYAFLALMRAFAAEGELERCEELREGMFSSRCAGWATVAQRQEADELCLEAAVASGYVSVPIVLRRKHSPTLPLYEGLSIDITCTLILLSFSGV